MSAEPSGPASSPFLDPFTAAKSDDTRLGQLTLANQTETDPAKKAEIKAALTQTTEHLSRLAGANPKNPELQRVAAHGFYTVGDYPRGLAAANKAVTAAQARGDVKAVDEALKMRALGFYHAGNFERATDDAKRVLHAQPEDPTALAVLRLANGRPRRGAGNGGVARSPEDEDLLRSAVEAASPLADPRVQAAAKRVAGHLQALKLLEEAARKLDIGDANAILGLTTQAQALDPGIADAYMMRGMALMYLKQAGDAIKELGRAIELWSKTAEAHADLLAQAMDTRSMLLAQSGDFASALADADGSVKYRPNGGRGYFNRAVANEGLRAKADLILADYKRAAQLEPKNFSYDYEKALARFAGGVPQPAEEPPPQPSPDSGSQRRLILTVFAAIIGAMAWFVLRARRAPPIPHHDGAPAPGLAAGRFELRDMIGQGGMGTVYRAFDRKLGRDVAAKRLRGELQANRSERERFLREARTVAALRHPNIVEIYDVVEGDDTVLIFEYIRGHTLAEVLVDTPHNRLLPSKVQELLGPLCAALDHAHGKHVIHRDLKPSNVMVDDAGHLKVMDFGIARQAKDSLATMTNTVAGTPVYMSPEQQEGIVGRETDLYALGVVLYELLTGRQPFPGPAQLQLKKAGEFPSPSTVVASLPKGLDAFFKKALSPRTDTRFHTAAELHAAFLASH